jgi:hypothetical protein
LGAEGPSLLECLFKMGAISMNIRQLLIVLILMPCCRAVFAQADETRYVNYNGITYCETYRNVQRAINETAYQQTTQTVYKEQLNTEVRDVTRTCWSSVTTYRAETEMVGKWNFFIEPYYETHWVAQTQWVPHSEVVKMPVTCRKVVPETQNVQVPVVKQKMVTEKVLISRVAVVNVPPNPSVSSGPIARPTPQSVPATTLDRYQPVQTGEQIGGIKRMDQDPPRYSTSPNALPASR